jgi:hypothetical protein
MKRIDTLTNAACYNGEMAEWSNAAVSKTVVRLPANRGFESPSLRIPNYSHPPAGGWDFLFHNQPSHACMNEGGYEIKNTYE